MAHVIDQWFAESMEISRTNGRPKERTLAEHKRALDRHLIPKIGSLACDELTVGALNAAISDIVTEGGSGTATAVRVRSALTKVCGYAVENDFLAYNFARETRRMGMTPGWWTR